MSKIEMQADSCILIYIGNIFGDGVIHSDGSLNSHEVMVFRSIIGECLHKPDQEVCGYIERVHDDSPWITMKAVVVKNMAGTSSDGEFEFSKEDSLTAYELIDKGDCLGIWHSHPNGKFIPSITDWHGHPRDPAVDMYIISITGGNTAHVHRYTEDDRP